MTNVDDDVKVWVAARMLALEKPEFSNGDLAKTISKMFKDDEKKMERFVANYCVANTAGSEGKHFNYLFKLGANRYRLFRQGDPIEFTHATAPTMPEVHRVPSEYKGLYSGGQRFPPELKPVGTPAKPDSVVKPTKDNKKTSAPEPVDPTLPLRGLKLDTTGFDAASPVSQARKTIFDMLFLEMGKIGSRLEAQRGENFVINLAPFNGTVYSLQNIPVKMPSGGTISHTAEIVIELENHRTLYVDIVESTARLEEIKSHAFDAMHLKKEKKDRYGILLFLKGPHGMLREQVEAICYSYDLFFGADANQVKDAAKFYALKAQILEWMAGKLKPTATAV